MAPMLQHLLQDASEPTPPSPSPPSPIQLFHAGAVLWQSYSAHTECYSYRRCRWCWRRPICHSRSPSTSESGRMLVCHAKEIDKMVRRRHAYTFINWTPLTARWEHWAHWVQAASDQLIRAQCKH